MGPRDPNFCPSSPPGRAREGPPPRQYDRDGWPALRGRIAAAFGSRTQDEWTRAFAGSDACVAPVLGLREAAQDPHLAARGTFASRDGVLQPAPAPRFSATPTAPVAAPPARGQDDPAAIAARWRAAAGHRAGGEAG